jgi:hypothetical protein
MKDAAVLDAELRFQEQYFGERRGGECVRHAS